jgi:hypothetical protein
VGDPELSEDLTEITINPKQPIKTAKNIIGLLEMGGGVVLQEVADQALAPHIANESVRDLGMILTGTLMNQSGQNDIANLGAGIAVGGVKRLVKKAISFFRGKKYQNMSLGTGTPSVTVVERTGGDLF